MANATTLDVVEGAKHGGDTRELLRQKHVVRVQEAQHVARARGDGRVHCTGLTALLLQDDPHVVTQREQARGDGNDDRPET